jgi:hypothetical protein
MFGFILFAQLRSSEPARRLRTPAKREGASAAAPPAALTAPCSASGRLTSSAKSDDDRLVRSAKAGSPARSATSPSEISTLNPRVVTLGGGRDLLLSLGNIFASGRGDTASLGESVPT